MPVSETCHEAFGDTLDSLQQQTHSDVKHLIQDGGSADGTFGEIRRYTGDRPNVVSELDFIFVLGLNLNEKDAASLVSPLILEFGMSVTMGSHRVVLYLWTGLPNRADADPVCWKILTSTAILGIIVANSLRNGNYGFPFFLVLYYDIFRSLRRGDVSLAISRRPEALASLW